jgi:hypothetical protein
MPPDLRKHTPCERFAISAPAWVDTRSTGQRPEVLRRLRAISRHFSPDETVVFEVAANRDFSIQATPDSLLLEHLQDATVKRLKLDNLETLHSRWLAFLRRMEADPLGSLAVQLADKPEDAATS